MGDLKPSVLRWFRHSSLASPRIVTDRPSWTWWFYSGVAAAVFAVLGYFLFDYGRYHAGFDRVDAIEERDRLLTRLSKLEASESQLRQQVVQLERSSQIDQHAATVVREEMKAAQQEMLHVKEELAFYRSIVSPEDGKQGLRIQNLKLRPVARSSSRYHYRVVLIQVLGKQVVNGTVQVYVDGHQNGELLRLSLKEIGVDVTRGHKLRFKSFQYVEGVLELPDDFVPNRVTVEAVRKGKKGTRVTRSFDWFVDSPLAGCARAREPCAQETTQEVG